MKPITYKFVMDGGGLLSGVELWQGDQHIAISMEAKNISRTGYKWGEIKEFIDNIKLPHMAPKRDPFKNYIQSVYEEEK